MTQSKKSCYHELFAGCVSVHSWCPGPVGSPRVHQSHTEPLQSPCWLDAVLWPKGLNRVAGAVQKIRGNRKPYRKQIRSILTFIGLQEQREAQQDTVVWRVAVRVTQLSDVSCVLTLIHLSLMDRWALISADQIGATETLAGNRNAHFSEQTRNTANRCCSQNSVHVGSTNNEQTDVKQVKTKAQTLTASGTERFSVR